MTKTPVPEYVELHAHSWFSLLDGTSAPDALVERAQQLGMRALALTDHDSLAGAVQFWRRAQEVGVHPVIGAEITLDTLVDGESATGNGNGATHLTLLAETQRGYANLCKLITAARVDHLPAPPETYDPIATASDWPGKIAPHLSWARLAEYTEGIIALTGCVRGPVAAPLLDRRPEDAECALHHLQSLFDKDHLFVELQHHRHPRSDWLVRRLATLARSCGLPMVATNNVHYAERSGYRLHDTLLAIDANLTLSEARRREILPGNDLYFLADGTEMARRFGGFLSDFPEAFANTLAIAERCQVSVDFSSRRLPGYLPPDSPISEFQYLCDLCREGFARRYSVANERAEKRLADELKIIERTKLAGFFLLVWDIVVFAKREGIRCQGRGSAAGSVVAYVLGITSVDPIEHNLLFERFLSPDVKTMPDIDIDFEASRREEVIQYVYRRYGRDHAAMVCNYITYHARGALRDLGKALDIPLLVVEQLAQQMGSNDPELAAERIEAIARGEIDGLEKTDKESVTEESAVSAKPSDNVLLLLADLMRQIDGLPRHLSIHSGGMLLTALPLDEVVPLEPATMPGRIVAQWDKYNSEDAGLIKLDILGLGMLGAISEAVAHADQMGEPTPDLNTLRLDDPEIYKMLQRGDTIGAFQVESRAQTQLLPRLKPACFSDIVIQIAIVRPGPIQGNAIHPLLRRRAGLEPVQYLHPNLKPALEETYGVIVYQEQILKVATAIAGFSSNEADHLRRAMSRARSRKDIEKIRDPFLEGARRMRVDTETAISICQQLLAFSGFGFPKSHSASFAVIAYQSMWLMRYRPAAFFAALMNQQPMGFYSVEVLAGAARRHGVEILPPCVVYSQEKYVPERTPRGRWALRTGLSAITLVGGNGRHALPSKAVEIILTARNKRSFTDLADFCKRTALDRVLVGNLIRAGACDAFLRGGASRRDLFWQLGGIDYMPNALPLPDVQIPADLPEIDALEQEVWEYQLMGLAPGGNIVRHHRTALRKRRIAATWEVKQIARGTWTRTAGVIAIRQHPQTAKGVIFLSLEDESGLLDLVVWPNVWKRLRDVLYYEPLVVVEGEVQREGAAVSVLVQHAVPLADFLDAEGTSAVARATKSWF